MKLVVLENLRECQNQSMVLEIVAITLKPEAGIKFCIYSIN